MHVICIEIKKIIEVRRRTEEEEEERQTQATRNYHAMKHCRSSFSKGNSSSFSIADCVQYFHLVDEVPTIDEGLGRKEASAIHSVNIVQSLAAPTNVWTDIVQLTECILRKETHIFVSVSLRKCTR